MPRRERPRRWRSLAAALAAGADPERLTFTETDAEAVARLIHAYRLRRYGNRAARRASHKHKR